MNHHDPEQEIADRFYAQHGPCCAGCDWWHRVNTLVGHAVPDGKFVCHSCDNPSCVNPEHLWIGDALSNVDDMIAKGRRVSPPPMRGTDHPKNKISEKTARAIKNALGTGKDIAAAHGVSRSLVYGIKRGTHWPHL